jgi:hypothetical protein
MKFRLQCANCNSVFFSPDRKSRYCPKCARKGAAKPAADRPPIPAPRGRPAENRSVKPGPGAGAAAQKKIEKKPQKPPKTIVMTPELREQIKQIYQEQFANTEILWRDMVSRISEKLWVGRKHVSAALREIVYPQITVTPELKDRIIEMYKDYVERSERPPAGRRKTISQVLEVPFGQVRDIVYQWSQSQYNQSPTPELSREQKFEVEKLYLDELKKQRYRLDEIAVKISEQLGYITSYQVRRWLDKLYDDDKKFQNAADVSPETEQAILDAYRRYLASPQPPELGLHATIAQAVGGVTNRQVHKVLQRYREQQRENYPLRNVQ